MKWRKFAAVLLAGAMMLLFAACGGSATKDTTTEAKDAATAQVSAHKVLTPGTDPANTEKSDETLTVGLSAEPSTLYGTAAGKTEMSVRQLIKH